MKRFLMNHILGVSLLFFLTHCSFVLFYGNLSTQLCRILCNPRYMTTALGFHFKNFMPYKSRAADHSQAKYQKLFVLLLYNFCLLLCVSLPTYKFNYKCITPHVTIKNQMHTKPKFLLKPNANKYKTQHIGQYMENSSMQPHTGEQPPCLMVAMDHFLHFQSTHLV